ncbi:MAG: hypothetical protein LBU65_08950 [Planctomycetaceae bacterium]|jgi:uncharacterized protein YukE|nr:hypothetical protein [Planctomycetaceae bacterium]
MSTLRVTPEQLRQVAGQLNQYAEQIGQLEGASRTAVDQIDWTGSTHQPVIEGQINDIAATIRETQGRMHNAAAQLTAYASRIDEAR